MKEMTPNQEERLFNTLDTAIAKHGTASVLCVVRSVLEEKALEVAEDKGDSRPWDWMASRVNDAVGAVDFIERKYLPREG